MLSGLPAIHRRLRHLLLASLLLISLPDALAQDGSLIDSLKKAIEREHDITGRIDLYVSLAEAYQNHNPDQAYDIAEQALQLAERTGDPEKIGRIHFLMGEIALRQDRLNVAEAAYLRSIRYLRQVGTPPLLIKVHMALGNRYIEVENYPEALDQYLKAVSLSEGTEENEQLAGLFNNLGVLYLKLNNTMKALELYNKALTLFEQSGDTTNVAGTTTNIGSIYLQLGEYALAREFYLKGYRIFGSIGHLGGQAHALFKLGSLDEQLGDLQQAEKTLRESLSLQDSMGILSGGSKMLFLAETSVVLGKVYLQLEKPDLAEKYLQQGYELALKENFYSLLVLASETLSTLYRQSGNYALALDYYALFKQYSDSLFNEDNVKKITQLEMQHQFDSRMKAAELERQMKEQKAKRLNLIYVAISIGLLLVLVIVVLLLRLEKNKKRKLQAERQLLQESLDHANKELTTYVMYLLRKNEFILTIIEKLKKARLDATPENKKLMAEMIGELKSNTGSISWEEFEVRFQEVHTDFYTKLRNEFPDLTNNEVRLCAFFRLNMTSKEIAAITYQSLNSIKVARYRLRKKLNIAKEESLISFLSRY